MATKKEIAYNILNLVSGGHSENTPMINVRQIEFIVDYYRGLLIRRAVERGDRLEEFEQTLDRTYFEVISKVEAGRFAGPFNTAPILRTELQIPTPIRLKEFPGLTYVGDVDWSRNYDLVNPHELKWQTGFNRFTNKSPRSTYLNDYIWIINPPDLYPYSQGDQLTIDDPSVATSNPYVKEGPGYLFGVRGIFEDPEEVAEFNETDLVDYPCPADMIQQITQSILNGEIRVLSGRPNDVVIDQLPVNRERSIEV